MGKGNDKKVIKQTKALLLRTIGNLMESHRERKFAYAQCATPLSRRLFCKRNNLVEPTVSHIETGLFLGLKFDQLRLYLATIYGRNDAVFLNSFRKVYDGLKELDDLLKKL